MQGCEEKLPHLLGDQRAASELTLLPFPGILGAFVLPCRLCRSSARSGCGCCSLLFLCTSTWQAGGKSSSSTSLAATVGLCTNQPPASECSALKHSPQRHHCGKQPDLLCLSIHSSKAVKTDDSSAWFRFPSF